MSELHIAESEDVADIRGIGEFLVHGNPAWISTVQGLGELPIQRGAFGVALAG